MISPVDLRLTPGTLMPALQVRTTAAIACGALHTIETEQTLIEDGGVRFLVRAVSSLRRKAREQKRRAATGKATAADFNPFLPPEPELTVGAIGDAHIAVLNKFNVLERHLLIVTRAFEHQERLLTQADFAALAWSMGEIDGLGFYNGGTVAGASQTHKHLQLVPLPLTDAMPGLPMEARFPSLVPGVPARLDDLPFRHAYASLEPGWWQQPETAAASLHTLYRCMLQDCGIGAANRSDGPWQDSPYNLLLRRGWMLLVPRRAEHCENISVNALGFAGSLFVRGEVEMEQVRQTGPMRILAAIGLPPQASA